VDDREFVDFGDNMTGHNKRDTRVFLHKELWVVP
jgi:hypothetical protein